MANNWDSAPGLRGAKEPPTVTHGTRIGRVTADHGG